MAAGYRQLSRHEHPDANHLAGQGLHQLLRRSIFAVRCVDGKRRPLVGIALADGVETWRSTPYGKYWSMVTDGKTILGLDETGTLYSLRPNPEKLEILAERKVTDQPSWVHLAVADGQLFIRYQKGLTVLAAS